MFAQIALCLVCNMRSILFPNKDPSKLKVFLNVLTARMATFRMLFIP